MFALRIPRIRGVRVHHRVATLIGSQHPGQPLPGSQAHPVGLNPTGSTSIGRPDSDVRLAPWTIKPPVRARVVGWVLSDSGGHKFYAGEAW